MRAPHLLSWMCHEDFVEPNFPLGPTKGTEDRQKSQGQ